MLAYYGSRISENMTRTPEGFLICRNVPIARLGMQKYLPSEIGLTGDSLVPVHRTADEVFASAAIASFEGKPVTLECENLHKYVSLNPSKIMTLFFDPAHMAKYTYFYLFCAYR